MGRAPCCDKANVKKGPWSPEEDAKLKSYIDENGTGGNWIALPQKIGLKRCGKSCRLRWLNYLRPNIKHGGFSEEEDNIICSLYISIGSRWSIIAAQLPGRTDNDIKNYWNTRLKKKLLGKQRKEQQQARRGGKQLEMKKGRDNSISMVSVNHCNQNPYWPELPVMPPVPYSIQEPSFNDHNSIRKLLIKLGGRFSCDDNNQPINATANTPQFRIDTSTVQPSYEPSNNTISASPLPNSHYTPILLGESSNFTADQLEEMVYNGNNPQRLHGMEYLYENIVNFQRSSGTSCVDQSMDWGDQMSTLICPSTTVSCSNYDGLQQGIVQECGYDEWNVTIPGQSDDNIVN